jgi:AcrR family transcriptional regulator
VPRAFTSDERDHITDQLRQAGRAAFASTGLRRTSVDDLARAAGISKGAFYLFYDSKEALFIDILERFEADFQRRVLDDVLQPSLNPGESLRLMLRASLDVRGTDPIFRKLTDADAEALFRRISPERAVALRQADLASVRRFLDYWRAQGYPIALGEEVLTGLLRAVVLTSFRQAEIGPGVYVRVVELMIDALAEHVLPATIQEAAHAR